MHPSLVLLKVTEGQMVMFRGWYCHDFGCDSEECYVLVICQSKVEFQCHKLYQNTKIDEIYL